MLDIDLKPKYFRELKRLVYIIQRTFYIICYMVVDMNSMNSMNCANSMNSVNSFNQFTSNLIANSAVCEK